METKEQLSLLGVSPEVSRNWCNETLVQNTTSPNTTRVPKLHLQHNLHVEVKGQFNTTLLHYATRSNNRSGSIVLST